MKKFLLLITLFAFIGFSASAQFSFGGKLGGSTTILTGIGLDGFMPYSKIKINGGAIINYSFGSKFAIPTEVLYQGKGAGYSYYEENDKGRFLLDIEQKLGYVSVPLMLQFKLGDRYNYFHFDGGVVSSSLVHSNFDGTKQEQLSNGDVLDPVSYEIEQSPAKFDLSYAFGIGLVANGLNFDFRYEVGTKKVFEQQDDGAPNIRNKSFQVSVGYTFTY